MNFIKTLGTGTIKYFKGLLAIGMLWLLPALGIFIFDSCNKLKHDNSKAGEAAIKFNEALDVAKKMLSPMMLDAANNLQSRISESTGRYFIDFPEGTSPEVITDFAADPTIQSLTNVLTSNGVSIDDTMNANSNLTILVQEEQIRTTLQPLVTEAKNYLIAKGVTDQQIADMLLEENAEEIDLIPFVKALVAIEQNQYAVRKLRLPFINEANALPHFVECGIAALGGDIIYSLSYSGASSWSWPVMKRVFTGVAKRLMGPIGVAIAVVTFTTCMLTT